MAKQGQSKPTKEMSTQDIFDAYEHARSGMSDRQIYDRLGITSHTFNKWQEKSPEFALAVTNGRKLSGKVEDTKTFSEYVYDRLEPELKAYWDVIEEGFTDPSALVRVEAMLADAGEKTRQALWVHALISCGFDANAACRAIGVPYQLVKKWAVEEPYFQKMLDQIEWHKANLYEAALIKLVRTGEPAAVIFANKTYNRKRGYGAEVTVKHGGEIAHAHTHDYVDIEDLDLDISTKRRMLNQVRNRDETVIEAEVETSEDQ